MSDPRDWQSIREDLESRDEEVRRLAVERAALLPPDEALHTLVDGLGDSSWRVRKSCVERLTALDDAERISELLVPCLADGENPGCRNSAAEALARFGSRSVPAILAATWQDDAGVRKLLVDSLATIGSSAAAPRLVEMLSAAVGRNGPGDWLDDIFERVQDVSHEGPHDDLTALVLERA